MSVAAVAAVTVAFGGLSPAAAQTAPGLTSAPPPGGVAGNGYLHQFTAAGAAATFSVRSGNLPPGLVLSAVGFLTGAPLAAGTFGPTTVCAAQLGAAPACQTFTIVILRRSPALLAAPSPGGALGTVVRETATIVGGLLPTGSVTFRLFSDEACAVQVFSSTNPMTALGVATSDPFVPRVPAVHRWTVRYTGDANNEPVATPCDPVNAVAISAAAPATTTTTVPPTTASPTTTTVPPTTTTTTPPTATTTTTSTTQPPLPTTTTPPTTSTTTTLPPPVTTTTAPSPTTTALPPTTTTTTLPPPATSTTTTTVLGPPPATTTSSTTTTSTTAPPPPVTTTTAPSTGQALDPVTSLAGWLFQTLGFG